MTKQVQQNHSKVPKPSNGFSWRDLLSPLIFLVVFVGLYLLASGKPAEPQVWVYFILVTLNLIVLTFLMDPELIHERANIGKNVHKSDLAYAFIVGRLGPILIIIFSVLDIRFGWTTQDMKIISLVAFIPLVAGLWLSDWAVLSNRFFSGVVRIQKERGHNVVSHGPYRYLRHPGYAGSILFNLATPLILKSLWGLVLALLVVIVIVLRTANEDRILHQELEGYPEYAQRVRYKLVPYLW